MRLCKDIIIAAKKKGINPFKTPFKPAELGLRARDYGAFADWCPRVNVKSGKWDKRVCLTVVQRRRDGKPLRYRLLPRKKWHRE